MASLVRWQASVAAVFTDAINVLCGFASNYSKRWRLDQWLQSLMFTAVDGNTVWDWLFSGIRGRVAA